MACPEKWPKDLPPDLQELKRRQEELARALVFRPLGFEPEIVGGADVSYLPEGRALGVIVVYHVKEKRLLSVASACLPVSFPYVPGFLSFREVPVLKEAARRLEVWPQVLLVDGQGILHPRRFGLACHLGLELALPTVGVAKKPLVGEFELPSSQAGSFTYIKVNGEVRGVALRTRKGVKPIYISPGHLIDLPSALAVVKSSLSGYRLPEPLRLAHLMTQRLKKDGRGDHSGRRDR